jgi:hypothetical protein
VITAKALKRHLKALGKELADNCYCENPDCESEKDHPYDGTGLGMPPYGFTLVTPAGDLDEAGNKHYIGAYWGIDGHVDEVVDHIDMLDELAENLVVVEHASGRWWRGTEFPR